MLQYKFVHILECDICKRKEISTEGLQVDFVAWARNVGWIVGTTTAYCPYCVKVQGMKRTPREPRQLTIFDDELENLEERDEEQEKDIIELRRDNALLKDIKNKQEKALEILKKKADFVFFGRSKEVKIEQVDSEDSLYLMNETGDTILPEEEFDTLKEMLCDELKEKIQAIDLKKSVASLEKKSKIKKGKL